MSKLGEDLMNAKRTRSNYEIIHEKSVSGSNVGCLLVVNSIALLVLLAVVIILVTHL